MAVNHGPQQSQNNVVRFDTSSFMTTLIVYSTIATWHVGTGELMTATDSIRTERCCSVTVPKREFLRP
jgi:hypothetical protein